MVKCSTALLFVSGCCAATRGLGLDLTSPLCRRERSAGASSRSRAQRGRCSRGLFRRKNYRVSWRPPGSRRRCSRCPHLTFYSGFWAKRARGRAAYCRDHETSSSGGDGRADPSAERYLLAAAWCGRRCAVYGRHRAKDEGRLAAAHGPDRLGCQPGDRDVAVRGPRSRAEGVGINDTFRKVGIAIGCRWGASSRAGATRWHAGRDPGATGDRPTTTSRRSRGEPRQRPRQTCRRAPAPAWQRRREGYYRDERSDAGGISPGGDVAALWLVRERDIRAASGRGRAPDRERRCPTGPANGQTRSRALAQGRPPRGRPLSFQA